MKKIGNVNLKNPLVLAPMAGVTDIAFRILCKRYGAALICTEMVNSNAVIRNNKATLRKMKFSTEELPVSIQLFGAKPKLLAESAKIVEKSGASIVDLNLGCPDPNVLKQGAGSALLRRPTRIKEIIESMVSAVSIPVTAKIRIGIKNDAKDYMKTAKIIEDAGASAIAVHARTVEQMYSGNAEWDAIKEIKENLSIPVIGNGDIFKPSDAKDLLRSTGCDLAMIGRGAIGNPQIFRYALSIIKGNKPKLLSYKEKLEQFFSYMDLSIQYKCLNFASAKRQCHAFTKGVPNAVELRDKIDRAKDVDELVENVRFFSDKYLFG